MGTTPSANRFVSRLFLGAVSLEAILLLVALPVTFFWVDIPNRDSWLTPWGSVFPLTCGFAIALGMLSALFAVALLQRGWLRAFAALWAVIHVACAVLVAQVMWREPRTTTSGLPRRQMAQVAHGAAGEPAPARVTAPRVRLATWVPSTANA